MERSARSTILTLFVERICNRKRIRIQFDDALQSWTIAVDLINSLEIFLGQRARCVFAIGHTQLQIGDGGFIEFKDICCR